MNDVDMGGTSDPRSGPPSLASTPGPTPVFGVSSLGPTPAPASGVGPTPAFGVGLGSAGGGGNFAFGSVPPPFRPPTFTTGGSVPAPDPIATISYVPFQLDPSKSDYLSLIRTAYIEEITIDYFLENPNTEQLRQIEQLFGDRFTANYVAPFKIKLKSKAARSPDLGVYIVRQGLPVGPLAGVGGARGGVPVGAVVGGGFGTAGPLGSFVSPADARIAFLAKDKKTQDAEAKAKRNEIQRAIAQKHIRQAFSRVEKDRKIIVDILTHFATATNKSRSDLINVPEGEYAEYFKAYLLSTETIDYTQIEIQTEAMINSAPEFGPEEKDRLLSSLQHTVSIRASNITEFIRTYTDQVYSYLCVFWLKFIGLCDLRTTMQVDYWDEELREKDLLTDICYIAAESAFIGKGPSAAGTRLQEATLREASINRWGRFLDTLYKKGWSSKSKDDWEYSTL